MAFTGSEFFLAALEVAREDFFTGSATFLAGSGAFLAGSATFLVGSAVAVVVFLATAAAFGLVVVVDFSPFSLVAGVSAVVAVAVFFAHGVVVGFVELAVAAAPPSSLTHGGRNVVRPPGALLALLVPVRGVTKGISTARWDLSGLLSGAC